MTIPFDNSYARLPEAFFARIEPTSVSAPVMIRLNRDLAAELGIDAAGPKPKPRFTHDRTMHLQSRTDR